MKFFHKHLLSIFLQTCLILSNQAQTNTDSLELSLEFAENQKNKIEILLKLSSELKNCDPDKALTFAEKAYMFSKAENYDEGILNSIIIKAYIYIGV